MQGVKLYIYIYIYIYIIIIIIISNSSSNISNCSSIIEITRVKHLTWKRIKAVSSYRQKRKYSNIY